MAGYVKIFREYYMSDLYKKSSCQQREVIQAIILRANYESKIINFGGVNRILELGDVWLSRKGLVKELSYASVQDSHVRYALDKMVKNGFLEAVTSSRSGGSIYKCTSKFYAEIAEPFDVRKLEKTTNEQPTNNQAITNQQPTINQPKQLSINSLQGVVTNQQPTNNPNLTNEQHENNLNELRKKKEERKNNITITSEKSDFGFEKGRDFIKNSDVEKERKKVAAKKESSEFPPAPAEYDVNPLDAYFLDKANIEHWGNRYPLLDIAEEFKSIRAALIKKAANGNAQLLNPYKYVLACLERAEKERQQRETSQKETKKLSNGKSKPTFAERAGKIISTEHFRIAAEQIGNSKVFV